LTDLKSRSPKLTLWDVSNITLDYYFQNQPPLKYVLVSHHFTLFTNPEQLWAERRHSPGFPTASECFIADVSRSKEREMFAYEGYRRKLDEIRGQAERVF